MSLSEKTINIVKATAPVLAEHGDAITRHFYQRLFSHHPELLNIFNVSHQETGRQQAALAAAVYGYAAHIDNLGALNNTVQRIAHKHASFNVKPEHYPIVGENLLAALACVLGDIATDEVLEAWGKAYQFLANIFIEVEESIYQESEGHKGGWRGTREFTVIRKVKESDLITSFYFEPVDGKPIADFKPGQYIGLYITPENSDNRCIRQYSLSDASNGKNYRISVKREGTGAIQGLVSNYLHDHVQEGDTVELSPPAGDFFLDTRHENPVVLISGGVGVTPLLSMLNTLIASNTREPVRFVHSAVNGSVHAFSDHINTLAEERDNLEKFVFYDQPANSDQHYDHAGRTDLNLIRGQIEIPGAHYYFCGPSGYMAMVNETLLSWGVPSENIHYEVFGPHKEI